MARGHPLGARRYAPTTQWPPRGARLTVTFAEGDDSASGIEMDVTFDLFTGVPLVAKHVRVRGGGSRRLATRALRFSPATPSSRRPTVPPTAARRRSAGGRCSRRGPTSRGAAATTLVDARYVETRAIRAERVVGYGTAGRALSWATTVRTSPRSALLMMHDDAHDYERQARSAARAARARAVVDGGALFFHLTDTSADGVRHAVDQMTQVGFELLIFSFGHGF